MEVWESDILAPWQSEGASEPLWLKRWFNQPSMEGEMTALGCAGTEAVIKAQWDPLRRREEKVRTEKCL